MNPIRAIFFSVFIGVSLYVVSLAYSADFYWCFKDHDTCALERINFYREQRDKRHADNKAAYELAESETDKYFNPKIDAIKLTLSAGAMLKEAKEGDKRNVPSEFFTLRGAFVQTAYADSLPNKQGNSKKLRYQALLTSVGSPYAGVDIESHCDSAGLTQYQCDILVGIAQSESASGTNFVSTKLPREEAIRLGKEFYHNPAGLKRCIEVQFMETSLFSDTPHQASTACPEPTKIPDENGMWIQKYDDWDTFWITYTHQMKDRYFDRGADSPASISRFYVGGSYEVKVGWVNRVESFMNKI